MYCTVLYCTVLHCTVLYCTVLNLTLKLITVLLATLHYCFVSHITIQYHLATARSIKLEICVHCTIFTPQETSLTDGSFTLSLGVTPLACLPDGYLSN
jgi:hypothetical protein